MNGEVNRAYTYYKMRHPESILLFRVKNQYEAYFDDAEKLRLLLGGSQLKFSIRPQTVSLPSDHICEYVSVLGDSGMKIQLIECRNDDGEFDVPDVIRLNSEEEADY